MVGFPGETEGDFETSLQFARDIGFSRLHCFAYSKRKGTVAAKMPDQVSQADKMRRNRLMIEMGAQTADAYARTLVGQTVEVLTETTRADGCVEGYTDTYVPVVVANAAEGVCCRVHLTHQIDGVCYGEAVE